MTRSGGRRTFLDAEWRWLVMLNFEVATEVVQSLVPRGVQLDLWEGRALVSVVGFRFLRTRVLGVPVPFHGAFDEVNVRFYVRREVLDGDVRHGVTFVRELVRRSAVAAAARLTYNEPYRVAPLRHTAPVAPTESPGRIAYHWRAHGRWGEVGATAVGAPAVPPAGSVAAFVAEHHWGYTRQRDGGTVEYEVTHPRWRVWDAESPTLAADVGDLVGTPFARALAAPAVSAFVAEGSAVSVFPPMRIGGSASP